MLKFRVFNLMKVYDINGRYLGVIDDLAIDFYHGKVSGFYLSRFTLFNKKNYVDISDVVSMQDEMVVKGLKEFKGLKFKELKYMDIYNENNVMEGVLEDIIIARDDYSIKGLVVSSGIFDRMFKGKKIFLIHCCILCDNFIIHRNDEKINFTSLPHSIGGKNNAKEV